MEDSRSRGARARRSSACRNCSAPSISAARRTHDLFALAEPIPGPSTDALGKLARELRIVIIASLFERRAAGLYHNTAAILGTDGEIAGLYRKMHIPDDPLYFEKFYFTPGDLGFRNFDTPFGRLGVLVCWDQWYPEGARLSALGGANILFYPTAIGWHPSEKAQYGAAQLDAWQNHPALPRHRQRHLRRGGEPRRLRRPARSTASNSGDRPSSPIPSGK